MKKAVILVLCAVATFGLNAQIYIDNQGNISNQGNALKNNSTETHAEKKPLFDPAKLEFGGNFGLQFGDYTHISISPQVGYKVSKYASLGIGIGYNYLSDSYYERSAKYTDKYSAVTVGTYGRFYPIEPMVVSVQPEISRVWRSSGDGAYKYSDTHVTPTLLIGGGVIYEGVMLMLQYDILQNKYSPYGNGIFYTAGFYFDL